MAKITDVTGVLYNGMWNYEFPFPKLNMRPLPEVDWVETKVYCDIFDGLHSQSGTYLETPAHLLGDESYPLIDVPIEKLVDIPVQIIKLSGFSAAGERQPVTREMLESAGIEDGVSIIISCDWGKYWRDERYLSASPYFEKDAMDYLISKKPFLLGTDFARWENLENPQGFFPDFYANDILMLGPLVNIEKIENKRAYLSALPLHIEKTCCAPCRAFIKE